MAVLESMSIPRVQFERLSGRPGNEQTPSCEIRAHFRPAGQGVAVVLLVARFFEGHPNPPFRLELGVEGRFRLGDGETPRALAESTGPATLYPYLRDEVAHITLKAGIPPVVLPVLRVTQTVAVREDVN